MPKYTIEQLQEMPEVEALMREVTHFMAEAPRNQVEIAALWAAMSGKLTLRLLMAGDFDAVRDSLQAVKKSLPTIQSNLTLASILGNYPEDN